MLFSLLFLLSNLTTASQPPKPLRELLSNCHRVALARNYKIHGRLNLTLKVDPKGNVLRVMATKESVGSPLLIRCVKYHLFKRKFPGKRVVKLRLSFPRSKGQYAVWSKDVPINKSLGNGSAARVLLDSASVGAKRNSLSLVRLSKGGRLTPRFHPKAGVFYFVVDGSGQIEWAQTVQKTKYLPVSRGSLVYLPRGCVYEIKGNSDPPLVLLTYFSQRGPEAYLAGGLTGDHTILIPPKGLSPSARVKPRLGAGRKARYQQVNFSRHGKFQSTRLLSIPGVGEVGLFHAPKGRAVRVTPPRRGSTMLFVAQGAGTLKNAKGSWPVQPGSGLYLPIAGRYSPALKKIPFYAIWFASRPGTKLTAGPR